MKAGTLLGVLAAAAAVAAIALSAPSRALDMASLSLPPATAN